MNQSNGWLLSALAMLGCCGLLQAQTAAAAERDEGPDWYRVELLLFANRDVEAAHSESWSLLPDLAYPQTLQAIAQRPHRASAEADFELVQFDQLLPEPVFDLAWETPVEQLLLDYQHSQLWRRPSISMEPLFELDVPVAFARLPSSESEFVSQRKRLNRSGTIEVLLHESWLQPMLDREASIPLQIDSSVLVGDFPELQGSILLYSARYLHLETNLWLNTDGSYLDTAATMPLPPLPPVADAAASMRYFEIAPLPHWLDLPAAVEPVVREEDAHPLEEEADLLEEEPDLMEEEPDPLEEAPDLTAPEESNDAEPEEDSEAEPEVVDSTQDSPPAWSEAMLQAWLTRPEYGYRHAVLLQQRRRLRSGELHYVDHPLMGLLIRVTRYPFEPFVDSSDPLNPAAAGRR